jgi:CRP-like cAMP-binding protein
MNLQAIQYQKEYKQFERKTQFFADLSQEENELIELVVIKKRFKKDQIVLSEEEGTKYMYLVYSGKVRVVKLSDDGREQIIALHKKGDYFGEMSILDGETAPATVIANEDAVIGLLHKVDFEYHLLSNEGIRRKFIDLLCMRLRDAWKMIKILSFDSAEHRIRIVLNRLQELYGVRDDRGVIINVKLTHQMIANYASVSRETATRALNKLERSGEIAALEHKAILLKEAFFGKLEELLV